MDETTRRQGARACGRLSWWLEGVARHAAKQADWCNEVARLAEVADDGRVYDAYLDEWTACARDLRALGDMAENMAEQWSRAAFALGADGLRDFVDAGGGEDDA